MKPRCITVSHVPKESHIIVRCEPELRQRLQRIAILERRNLSDLARIVFEDYINQQERARHLILRDVAPNFAPKAADPEAVRQKIGDIVATTYAKPKRRRKHSTK